MMQSVLVVDDSAVNRRVASAALRSDFEVDVAESGSKAIQAVRTKKYSAIIMDLDMPGINGIDTARLIRLIEQFNDERTPIIAYTASAEDRSAQCLMAGMDDYIRKPAPAVALVACLNRLAVVTQVTTATFYIRWTASHQHAEIA